MSYDDADAARKRLSCVCSKYRKKKEKIPYEMPILLSR